MKIIAISLFYKPIWPGFGTRYPELLIDEAAKSGNFVTVYTSQIPKNMKVDEKYRSNGIVEKIEEGYVKIHRLWTPNILHEGIGKRTLTYFIFNLIFDFSRT